MILDADERFNPYMPELNCEGDDSWDIVSLVPPNLTVMPTNNLNIQGFALKDVMPIINYVIENGHLMELCGFSAGQYCADNCLSELNVTREEAFDISLYSAGFTGLNFKNPTSLYFFQKWFHHAKEEKAFIGDWNNNNKQCSDDERCLGHRHDQSVASIIAHKLRMTKINPTFMQYIYPNTEIKEETIFACQGII
jgi:hypothetical protein